MVVIRHDRGSENVIIIEGPDGSGKTRLQGMLSKALALPLHERASDSIKGPVKNLSTWVYNDVSTLETQPLSIYDRHPLISEFIYGPICRSYLDPNMLSPAIPMMIDQLAKKSLVIFCRPPNREIMTNVNRSGPQQMPGVVTHAMGITYAYDAMRLFWKGDQIGFDYTDVNAYNNVIIACRLHVANWSANV